MQRLIGTVQGSVLRLVRYAIFISPIFDLEDLATFADDNFTITVDKNLYQAKIKLETSLSTISNWMKQSGLKINESKTEYCVFSRTDIAPSFLNVNGVLVKSKKVINVLGILFDSKLQWGPHVEKTIQKAEKALNAIRLLRK